MSVFLLFTIAIPLWASVNESDPEYNQELPGRGRDIEFIYDEYYESDTEDTDQESESDYISGRDSTVAIGRVTVTRNAQGIVNITIPGHLTVDYIGFSTDYDIEFFVTAPVGRHFDIDTDLIVSEGIEITFGPVVRNCGRLFFVMSAHVSSDSGSGSNNNNGNNNDNDNEPETDGYVGIIFYSGPGRMPYGESGSMLGPAALLVPSGPIPYPPNGYTFAGWYYGNSRVNFPFYATANMTLEARYNQIPAGDAAGTTFMLTYRPTGGVMPQGEPLTRNLPINTMLRELPTPTRDGHIFASWMIGTNLATLPLLVTSNLELTAVWVRLEDPPETNAYVAATAQNSENSSDTAEPDTYAAIFNPSPGVFASGETGLRIGPYGTYITDIPVPTRSGYIFGGWRFPNGHTLYGNLSLRGDMLMTAIWNVDPYATPTPTPTPSPTPTPTPTPAPGTAGRPNPATSPMQISFMIFGMVMIAAISAMGITKLSRRQMTAAGEYRSKVARYNREKRISDLLDE